MYAELGREFYLRELRIKQEEVPDLLVLHGEYDIPDVLQRVRSKLTEVRLPLWNVLLGRYRRRRIAYVPEAGAWMAGVAAHAFCAVGCPLVLQTGFFGGLHPEMLIGDVLIVTEAYPGEGTARYYQRRGIPRASTQVTEILAEKCRAASLTVWIGPVMSTGAMFAETEKAVRSWSHAGYLGADGETAATFAVAHRFSVPCGAVLVHSDHVIAAGTFQSKSKEDRQRELWATERVLEVVLDFELPT